MIAVPRLRALWAIACVTLRAPGEELAAQQPVRDTIPSDTTRFDPLCNNNVDMTGEELAADPGEGSGGCADGTAHRVQAMITHIF